MTGEPISGPTSISWQRCAICNFWIYNRSGGPWAHLDGGVHIDAPVSHDATPAQVSSR